MKSNRQLAFNSGFHQFIKQALDTFKPKPFEPHISGAKIAAKPWTSGANYLSKGIGSSEAWSSPYKNSKTPDIQDLMLQAPDKNKYSNWLSRLWTGSHGGISTSLDRGLLGHFRDPQKRYNTVLRDIYEGFRTETDPTKRRNYYQSLQNATGGNISKAIPEYAKQYQQDASQRWAESIGGYENA